MIIVNNPKLAFKDDRKDGISACLRVRNGEDYLEVSIMSVINQVDEIICVFNDSQDNTEKILCNLEQKYPDKIFVYKYIPIVYAPNTDNYKKTPPNSVNALCYYYNFALSKTTYTHIFKLDDDQIFFPNILRKLKKVVTKNKHFGLQGLNLIDYKENLYVNTKLELKTSGVDILLFKYNNTCHFKKNKKYEVFTGKIGRRIKIQLSFFHLKRCKKDRGLNNYDIDTNLNSRYLNINKRWFSTLTNENLKSYEESQYNNKFPHPYTLGFKYINNSKKIYKYELFNKFEDKLNIKTRKNIFVFGNGPQLSFMNNFVEKLKNKLVFRINNFNEKSNGDNLYFDIFCFAPGIIEDMLNSIKNNDLKNKKIIIMRHQKGHLGAETHYKDKFELLIKTLKGVNFDLNNIEYLNENFFKELQIKTNIKSGTCRWPTTGFCCLEHINKKYTNENIFIHGFSLTNDDYKKDPFYKKGYPRNHPCLIEMKIIQNHVNNGRFIYI